MVSTAYCSVINSSGCYAKTSQFFGPHVGPSQMDDPMVGRFICQILFMLFIFYRGWVGEPSLKKEYCVCYSLIAESVQPQVNPFWYPERMAIYWVNSYPFFGCHITGTSSYMKKAQKHGTSPQMALQEIHGIGCFLRHIL